jgi:hypothetical protein
MIFAAMALLAEGQCLNALLTLQMEISLYFPCRHSNTNGVHDGMAFDFAVENIKKK